MTESYCRRIAEWQSCKRDVMRVIVEHRNRVCAAKKTSSARSDRNATRSVGKKLSGRSNQTTRCWVASLNCDDWRQRDATAVSGCEVHDNV
jgi:hypothetical protein